MHDPGRLGCVVQLLIQMTDSNTHEHKRSWSASPSCSSSTPTMQVRILLPVAPVASPGSAAAMTHVGEEEVSVWHDLTLGVGAKISIGTASFWLIWMLSFGGDQWRRPWGERKGGGDETLYGVGFMLRARAMATVYLFSVLSRIHPGCIQCHLGPDRCDTGNPSQHHQNITVWSPLQSWTMLSA